MIRGTCGLQRCHLLLIGEAAQRTAMLHGTCVFDRANAKLTSHTLMSLSLVQDGKARKLVLWCAYGKLARMWFVNVAPELQRQLLRDASAARQVALQSQKLKFKEQFDTTGSLNLGSGSPSQEL